MFIIVVAIPPLLFLSGALVWNQHAFTVYRSAVSKPWGEAIEKYDWQRCAFWHDVAIAFPLQEPAYVFNPIRWFTCWNWKPPAYKPTVFIVQSQKVN